MPSLINDGHIVQTETLMSYLTINRRAALMGGALAVAAPAVLSSANPAAAAGASDLPMRAVQPVSYTHLTLPTTPYV